MAFQIIMRVKALCRFGQQYRMYSAGLAIPIPSLIGLSFL